MVQPLIVRADHNPRQMLRISVPSPATCPPSPCDPPLRSLFRRRPLWRRTGLWTLGAAALLLAGHGSALVLEKPIEGPLTLAHFQSDNSACYDRASRPNLAVVDGHLHLRPFGGAPIPFQDLLRMVRRSGVLFVAGYGIGQRLPVDSPCTYYLDCPGVPVLPSLKNDFHNAQSLLDHPPEDLKVVLSMTFPTWLILSRCWRGCVCWSGSIRACSAGWAR